MAAPDDISAALARMEALASPGGAARGGARPGGAPSGTAASSAAPVPKTYLGLTRTATYGFLMALPLVVAYEALVRLTLGDVGIRVGADVWVRSLLAQVGAGGTWPFALAVALLGLVLVARERRRTGPIPIRRPYLAGMIAESAVWAVLMLVVVSNVVGHLFAFAPVESVAAPMAQAGGGAAGFWGQIALSLGAGVYEEFVFRVLLVGGMAWTLRKLWPTGPAYLFAAVVGAAIFSAVHYTGSLGDPFTWSSFTFRFLLGLVLNGLFLTRGFGVAAWSHALYDVFVTVLNT